jgi:hypothetical protein
MPPARSSSSTEPLPIVCVLSITARASGVTEVLVQLAEGERVRVLLPTRKASIAGVTLSAAAIGSLQARADTFR